MTREEALPYVSWTVDDSLNTGHHTMPSFSIPENARLVGWQCGFEPLFVACFSYLPGVTLDVDEAEELATDFLQERGWFSDDGPTPPDFIL